MALLSDIKEVLRISASTIAFDDEIQDLIDYVKKDLKMCGVKESAIVDTDDLIKRAIIVYVKANFGWDNPDAERLQISYEMIKNHLSFAEDYTKEVV